MQATKPKTLKFNPEQAKAVLESRKTQTRRPLDPQPVMKHDGKRILSVERLADDGSFEDAVGAIHTCPYGKVGIWFPVDDITQQIVSLRIEQIQDTGEENAITEGVEYLSCPQCGYSEYLSHGATLKTRCGSEGCGLDYLSAIESFRNLWESIYPGSWERNDFCWVIEFKKVEA